MSIFHDPAVLMQKARQQLQEKAVSTAQQKFMGMVYSAKKGEEPASPEVAKAAEGMSKKEAKKFAKTKHKGLPTHKEEVNIISHLIENGFAETEENAQRIMDNMSESWLESIVEGEFRSLGRSDRNDGRNRYMGSPTPEQEADEKRRGDAAAEKAKAKLKRSLARERN